MRTSRRELLRVGLGGLGVISLGGTMPAFLSKFAMADALRPPAALADDNVLVRVELSRGNDGLNTVIPAGNDVYLKSRPVIGIKDRLNRLNDTLALNPGMTAFKEM